MTENGMPDLTNFFGAYSGFDQRLYDRFDVKRGLRNADGSGVVVGLTSVSNVHGYVIDEGEMVPEEGKLTLRGYDIVDLVESVAADGRQGFEEVAYLLWSGNLPSKSELAWLQENIDEYRDLPNNFVSNLLMNYPSDDVMNMLGRSVLMLYANDPKASNPEMDPEHEVSVAISLLSRLPRVAVLSYLLINQRRGNPMFINPPQAGLSTAETLFYMLRQDREWTPEEAQMLDIMLMLHAEHGGGNNSTFTTRCLTSSGTDAYSAYAGGIGSLKGPRHGSANIRATAQQVDLMNTVEDWTDEEQVADYLRATIRKETGDKSGLIYGMGHAVYTLSDPRSILCKKFAKKLAEGTEYEPQFKLIETIERLTPEIFLEVKGSSKTICSNIDMYSGLVYKMLGIPEELYTPIFACSRFAGWVAHRFEEMVEGRRIMRPAFKSTVIERDYVPLDARGAVSEDEEIIRDVPSARGYSYD